MVQMCKLNLFVTCLYNELLGTTTIPDPGQLIAILRMSLKVHEFESFYVRDRTVCVCVFSSEGEYTPRECGQGIPLVLKCQVVLGLQIFDMKPSAKCGGCKIMSVSRL